MLKEMRKYIIVVLMVCPALNLQAGHTDSLQCNTHSCCCGNYPTPAGVMISHIHPKGEWMIGYKYMTMGMNGIMKGSQYTGKEDLFNDYLMVPEHMQMNMHMLMAMYGLSHHLTLMAMFNYNTTSMSMSMFGAGNHHHHGTTDHLDDHMMVSAGLSDIKLYALYSPLNKRNHQLILGAGLNIPTGSTGVKGESGPMMYPDENLPYAMQLGSGTYDILPCVNYLYQNRKITAGAQVSAIVRTGTAPQGYTLGNETTVSGWLAYQWINILSSSVRIEQTQSRKISGNDPSLYIYNEPSANPVNYGGQKTTCYLGAVIQPQKGLLKNTGLGVEYGLPIYQYWNGIQMKLQHVLNASVSLGF